MATWRASQSWDTPMSRTYLPFSQQKLAAVDVRRPGTLCMPCRLCRVSSLSICWLCKGQGKGSYLPSFSSVLSISSLVMPKPSQ